MLEPEKKICQSERKTALALEQRLKAFSDLGLLEAETIPVFEAATQTAADFLQVPICILGFLDQNRHWFKSAVGLSRLGLMNKLAQERQLLSEDSFCTHVVERQHILAINDTLSDPAFAKSLLVQHYGIRAYLGVPLVDAAGHCLGSIAVMDLEPRNFTGGDIKFLEIIARWSMSEFERNRLLQGKEQFKAVDVQKTGTERYSSSLLSFLPDSLSTVQVKLELLAQLTQELRTPLTTVVGMANVVSREIYGPLTSKQKEYLEIIQTSSRYLLSMVGEISELGALHNSTQALNLTSMDIEMLVQQVINSLEAAANQREQTIRLSLEPGRSRTLLLDKDKVRQLLHNLLSSVIHAATTGSIIRIHVSYQECKLNFTVSVSHPWLGNGLTQVDPYFQQLLAPLITEGQNQAAISLGDFGAGELSVLREIPLASSVNKLESYSEIVLPATTDQSTNMSAANSSAQLVHNSESEMAQPSSFNYSRESLRLLLSCHLAELHGGKIFIQGTPESGYRYVVRLAELAAADQSP